jgi:threonine dehydrogenase-like Zn-dependent dehydrogenase
MKAVTRHGKRGVRVEHVPDRTIQQPTDQEGCVKVVLKTA